MFSRIRVYLFAVAAFAVMQPCHARADEDAISPKEIAKFSQAWDMFTQGCVGHREDLDKWVRSAGFSPYEYLTPRAFGEEFGDDYSWPTRDKAVRMVGIRDGNAFVIEYKNMGCTVLMDAKVPASFIRDRVLEYLPRLQQQLEATNALDIRPTDRGHFQFLIATRANGPDGSFTILIETSPVGVTVLHFYQAGRNNLLPDPER